MLFPSPFSSTQATTHLHTPTGTETGDAYLSADPPRNADTGLPVCYCSLRKEGRKTERGREGKKIGGQRKREGAF